MNKKPIVCWIVSLMFGVLLTSVCYAERLHSMVAYSLKNNIIPRLDKAEKLLDQGDAHSAKASYDTALLEWQTIHKDFKGKFDINHPDIVAVQKRFDAIEDRLKPAAGPKPTTAPTPVPASGPKDPPATMRYSMKQIHGNLEKAGRLLDQGNAHSARSNLESAQMQWQTLQKDFAGQFDTNHPDVSAIQNQIDTLAAKLTANAAEKAEKTPAPVVRPDASAPPSAMLYVMKQIHASLDKAEQYALAQNLAQAKTSLEGAEQQWTAQKEWNKGKYDPQHEEIVALSEKFARVKTIIGSADARVAGSAKTTTPSSASSGPGAPSAAMRYTMKQIKATLDGAQQDIDGQRLNQAKNSFENARQNWEAFQKDYRGKYDPQHPEIVALTEKYNRVKAALEALGGQAAAAAENLPAVLAAITASSDKLQKAYDKAYAGFRSLSSLVSDGDADKLSEKMAEVFPSVERVYTLLPDAMAAARDFRKQFPDFSTLGNLVKDGRAAGQKVERLESFPARWLEASSYFIEEAMKEAENNIRTHGIGKLSTLEGSDQSLKSYAADSAEKLVVVFSSILLDMIPVILPELSAEVQVLVPEIVKTRQKAMARVEPMRADIQKVTAAVRKIRKDVQDAAQRKIAQARFPKSEYHGGEWKDAEKDIRKAWAEAIPDKQLIKIDIYRPWEVREEVRWKNDSWVFNTYRYIGANCLAKLSDGKYRVYRMTYRNTKQGGGWSELKHWSVGHSYEILEENINK